ncbi:hypothetical protein ES332_D11G070500v1 [Gossypium tomentosum]|uniref:Uncharacterized protein n=1 Tax=Gossypium tomentosum TaxID=34277 RepID=A0A5D2IK37_GOSTO|nr:hypothetical protein ES332_D11G070500v1 [Gossypium tomentosum]
MTSATPLFRSISNHKLPTPSSTTSPTKLSGESPQLSSASTQLHLGISVIIDSPLSHRTHLDRLISLAASAGARLLIVECRPSDEAKWRERLEGRDKSWHKPTSWEELQELIKGYGGCTEYDVGDVPKMVVDTTAPNLGVEELVSSVVRFIASS